MIRLLRAFLLAGILLYCVFSANAQVPGEGAAPTESPQRLSADDAVDMAIRNNLNLEMARISLDITKRKADLVWNQFVPTVGVNGTLSRSNWATETQGMNFPPIVVPSQTLPQWSIMGQLSAELTFSFALIEGIRAIKLDYAAGIVGFERAKLQMEQGVRKMYNNILLLEANAALLDESYRNTQRQSALAEAAFRAGLAPRLNWLQAQVAVENMRPQVNELENTRRNLKGSFALLLGLPFDAPFELEPLELGGAYIPEDTAELISQVAASTTGANPGIQELQAGIMSVLAQRRALRLQNYTPFLRFGWTLSSAFAADPLKDSWFQGDNWTSKGQAGGAFSITVGMSFNSLFPFTIEGQRLRDMDANLRIQNIRLAQSIRETELEVFTKINSLEHILGTVRVQQSTVSLAEQSYRLSEEAFRAGLQDFQVVQSASLALHQARLQLLSGQFNFLNDLIDLEYSIGVPFGTLSGNRSTE